jgi:pimeloyl-ACP methyl ester carboxylesterase
VHNVFGDSLRVTPDLVDRYYDLTRREGNRAALALRLAQSQGDTDTAAIRSIAVPTLVLWGGRDQLIPPDHAARFGRDIAGSRVVMYPALGHVPHEEDPVATLAAVRTFLAPPADVAR